MALPRRRAAPRRFLTAIVFATGAVFATAAAPCAARAFAQEAGGREEGAAVVSPPPGAGRVDPEVRQRFQELRRRRMREYLKLQDTQVEKLERELEAFHWKNAELRHERTRLLAELRRALDDGRAEEEELRRRMEALEDNDAAREHAIAELRERLGRDLTLEQRARLRLFTERFGTQVREGARRIRERRESIRGGVLGGPSRPRVQPRGLDE